MKILYLGAARPDLFEIFKKSGDDVFATEDKDLGTQKIKGADFLVSYRYRYKVSAEILRMFGSRAINLHISLLPWNRGADPNLWSFLENSPKGVTIHRMAEGFDEGEILLQKEIFFETEKTLKDTYERLIQEMDQLLIDNWPLLRDEKVHSRPQGTGGSYHRSKDKEPFSKLLTQGWDTPVKLLEGKALQREFER